MRNAVKVCLLVLAVSFGFCPPTIAGQYQDARTAEAEGDHERALKLLMSLEGNGEAKVLHFIGYLHYNGKGTLQNYELALEYFQRAAKKNYPSSQRFLGLMYAEGEGVKQDFNEAMRWMQLAADQGDATALLWFGWAYEGSALTEPNLVKSHMHYNLASYAYAKQLKTDPELINYSEQHAFVEEHLRLATDSRNRVAEIMTTEQLAEAQKLAADWRPKN